MRSSSAQELQRFKRNSLHNAPRSNDQHSSFSNLPMNGNQLNASWEVPPETNSTNSPVRPSAATELLFADNRRGSNGVIPGQKVLHYPKQTRRSQTENSPGMIGDERLNSSLSKLTRPRRSRSRIYDDPSVISGYNSVPIISLDRLPRGGISLETKAVGRIQFGIPPETIKDSMALGFEVPNAYIVPIERFCREMGPALGINLAEFEFPAYFNYFVRQKRCTLLVDSLDAEHNIRRVFGETLLGPGQFRDHTVPKPNEDEDFDPSFPRDARPNFYKEFYHFRTAEKSTSFQELTIDTLLEFCHFKGSQQGRVSGVTHDKLGVPPTLGLTPFTDNPIEDSEVNRHQGVTFDSDNDRMDESTRFEENSGDKDGDEPTGRLRRTMSDPDIRQTTLEDLIPAPATIPASPAIDEPTLLPTFNPDTTPGKRMPRRGSLDSKNSFASKRSKDMSWVSGASFMVAPEEEDDPKNKSWMYSQAKWLGEVATIYPASATAEEKETNSCARVEIFKMTGGTEYIVHDVDEKNIIVGKARFSGTVRVPDEIAVEGFLARDSEDDLVLEDEEEDEECEESEHPSEHPSRSEAGLRRIAPPTFHPPSFGVTVLGNSHGFDKNGSVSGYVLWINGRGVMIDPPPYSSATLEREGIRPQMIMAIIITHCHADHDAGTFQKVMTGSRVAIITTPTIYKSFIRKYAALSGLSPTLLRHSHRHRPAIIGQPLRFQGATFSFTYTLHTIPCIAFRVEWRGRSMVFTGDHLNSPPMLDSLQCLGVLTKERADDLRHLPLQECDVLLHEAGAPPIHTPLSVLNELPEDVKKRLFVVHTSALPPDSDLRVAPTGTAGTIRLDELHPIAYGNQDQPPDTDQTTNGGTGLNGGRYLPPIMDSYQRFPFGESVYDQTQEYFGGSMSNMWQREGHVGSARRRRFEPNNPPPLVFLRPTCVSDAWFILNLLSNVPFLSSLSYSNTMEVLEIAQVELFCPNEIIIPGERRSEVLCVVWEGTCVERDANEVGMYSEYSMENMEHLENSGNHSFSDQELERVVYLTEEDADPGDRPTVWHAGDWTGPLALQPDQERSAEPFDADSVKDIVALSTEGVKVIMLNMKDLHQILKSGSKLFRKYLALKEKQAAEEAAMKAQIIRNETELGSFPPNGSNSFSDDGASSQPQHSPNQWYAYDSVLEVLKCNSALGMLTALQKRHLESLAEGPRYFEVGQYLWQVGEPVDYAFLIVAGTAKFAPKSDEEIWRNRRGSTGNIGPNMPRPLEKKPVEEDKQLFKVPPNSEYARLEIGLQLRVEEMDMDVYDQARELLPKEERMRNARDRFANKVLARLYARRAYTDGLVFSRGHLLSDTSRMVSGNLAHIHHNTGRQGSMGSIAHGLNIDHHNHTSNIAAGPDGCVVMVFPRSSLVQFLDGNPGVLLSLLGTQVVV